MLKDIATYNAYKILHRKFCLETILWVLCNQTFVRYGNQRNDMKVCLNVIYTHTECVSVYYDILCI